MPDRPEYPTVEWPQAVDRRLRHGIAMQLVPFAPDWKFPPLDFEAGFCRGSLHHLDGLGHDLEPDIVSQQDSDLQHSSSPIEWAADTTLIQQRADAVSPRA